MDDPRFADFEKRIAALEKKAKGSTVAEKGTDPPKAAEKGHK